MRIVTCGKLRVSFVSFMLVHLPTVALAYPSFSINDVTVEEGNTGVAVATFTVTRSETGLSTLPPRTFSRKHS